MSVAGRCLCGIVRWSVQLPLVRMMYCQCSMCRKHGGGAFATDALSSADAVAYTSGADNVETFRASAQGARPFCRTCGSGTAWIDLDNGYALSGAGSLDDALGTEPQFHMFAGSKASWHEITDELPRYEAFPPEFGMSAVEGPRRERADGAAIGGSCLCGDVAFELEGAPLRMYHCHCQRCRLSSGSAHASIAFAALPGFRWLRGERSVANFALPGAQFFGTAFCTRCGGKLPRTLDAVGLACIPCGSLDDDPRLRAQAHAYVDSKASWFRFGDDALPRFAQAASV